jgi:type VI secretion system secreted protein Hcp
MAVDMFLKLTGVEGESKDEKHSGEIDIYSWSWGMTQTGTFGMGGGGGAGKVNVHDLTITKKMCKASNAITQHCCSGKHFDDAILVCRKAGGNQEEYLKITFDKVLVSSLQVSGTDGSDQVMETVSLNFAGFVVEYGEQLDGGGLGPTSPYGWDVKKNVKKP